MRVRWTPEAANDLAAISAYLVRHLPGYRDQTINKLYRAILELRRFPRRGREGIEGTRELLFPPMPYVVVYRLQDNTIEVVRILHGAQDR